MTKTEDIRTHLTETYPTNKVPYGELSNIAHKFGVSRELVRQQYSFLKFGREDRQVKRKLCLSCECGKPRQSASRMYCDECNEVSLCCENCGVVFKRRLVILLRNIHHGRTHRVFCSKSCAGAVVGKDS